MIGERIGGRGLIVVAFALVVIFTCLTMCTQRSHARDLGQWQDSDPQLREWYGSLMQPGKPLVPCCGEADAYFADKVEVEGDKVIATITDERPDAPLGRPHIAPGTRIEIPSHVMKNSQGNPTGHNVIFVNSAMQVLCFVTGTLS
jgi:hypothetical protein